MRWIETRPAIGTVLLLVLLGSAAGCDCDKIEARYSRAVEEAKDCEVDADCQAIKQPCPLKAEGEKGCCIAVNHTVSEEELKKIRDDYYDALCPAEICACLDCRGRTPCVEGRCEYDDTSEPPVYQPADELPGPDASLL
jgi:hypothetical protein